MNGQAQCGLYFNLPPFFTCSFLSLLLGILESPRPVVSMVQESADNLCAFNLLGTLTSQLQENESKRKRTQGLLLSKDWDLFSWSGIYTHTHTPRAHCLEWEKSSPPIFPSEFTWKQSSVRKGSSAPPSRTCHFLQSLVGKLRQGRPLQSARLVLCRDPTLLP